MSTMEQFQWLIVHFGRLPSHLHLVSPNKGQSAVPGHLFVGRGSLGDCGTVLVGLREKIHNHSAKECRTLHSFAE